MRSGTRRWLLLALWLAIAAHRMGWHAFVLGLRERGGRGGSIEG